MLAKEFVEQRSFWRAEHEYAMDFDACWAVVLRVLYSMKTKSNSWLLIRRLISARTKDAILPRKVRTEPWPTLPNG